LDGSVVVDRELRDEMTRANGRRLMVRPRNLHCMHTKFQDHHCFVASLEIRRKHAPGSSGDDAPPA